MKLTKATVAQIKNLISAGFNPAEISRATGASINQVWSLAPRF